MDEATRISLKDQFNSLLVRAIEGRRGGMALMRVLEELDFYNSPASAKHHLNVPGGLVLHSLNVARAALELCDKMPQFAKCNKGAVLTAALLHDVCKAGQYIKKPDGSYRYEDSHLMGHGEASVSIIKDWIFLTDTEALAIRWHMGAYSGEQDWGTLGKVYDRCPEALRLHMADMIAPLTSPQEFPFWREVYARDCEIKGKRPSRKIVQGGSTESDKALMRWHDGLHSMAAEYAMWGNGMALPNALFFVKNAFRELGKPAEDVKLGSLFDGSGTMPLCAVMCGGRAVWASEVEPYPIAVTRTHLPHMKHLGSVKDVRGDKIEPVDIITFGSPCQDLSIAGKRAGLGGGRSGLFWEAIRIIIEMLVATNSKYPRFVIWENVPGALSSNGGKDFETVLNELLRIRGFAGGRADKPILQHGKWGGFANYGAVAYRIVNAQYWGIPQRRRRVYAVCDTRRESAGVVAFERKGTQWDFNPCIPKGEEIAGLTADCYSWHDRMVASRPAGGGQHGAYTVKIRSGCEGGGKGALVQKELSATLATHQDQTLFELRNMVLNDQGGGRMSVTQGTSGTLRAQEHGHPPITFDKMGGTEKT